MPLLVEICCEGIASALNAARGGADRVELCADLAVGGVTPSAGAIAVAAQYAPTTVHVLIRPRGGDFVYDEHELKVMKRDVEYACHAGGVRGVVLGALDRGNRIDLAVIRSLVKRARPLSVTFHRAFDVVRDPFEALEQLIDLGIERVLTSGRPGPARASLELIGQLVERARGRIEILVGGSVTPDDFSALAALGVREVHIGSAACDKAGTSAPLVAEIMARARSEQRL